MIKGTYFEKDRNWHVQVPDLALAVCGESLEKAMKAIVAAVEGLVGMDGFEARAVQTAKQRVQQAFSITPSDSKYIQAFLKWCDLRSTRLDNRIENPHEVLSVLAQLVRKCHTTAKSKGWWDSDRNDGELIALIHAEASEALEWLRKGAEKPSDHIPDFLGVEEELADILIRIFDFCGARNYDLGGALLAKMKFNEGREYRHGKEF